MMKAILGSALGGVIAGVVALVASAQGRTAAPANPVRTVRLGINGLILFGLTTAFFFAAIQRTWPQRG